MADKNQLQDDVHFMATTLKTLLRVIFWGIVIVVLVAGITQMA